MSSKQSSGKARGYISHSYYCVGKRNGLCDLPGISQNFLEVQFLNLIKDWNYNELINDEVNSDTPPVNVEDKVKMLKKELSDIESRRSKWQYAWLNNLISDDDLKNRKHEEDSNEERVKQELSKLTQNEQANKSKEQLALSLKKAI